MQRALRLTITAVGEPDSVFLTPCEPITLHESAIESDEPEVEESGAVGRAFDEDEAADALAGLAESDMLILMESGEQELPVRRAS